MRNAFDAQAEAAVQKRVTGLEAATGIEVVSAVIARADSYPEIPWKAFALGASLAALASIGAALLDPGWDASHAILEATSAVLATGAAAAVATLWMAPFARLFLPRQRREGEVLQYAQALFLETGMFRTSRHEGVLVLVSLFERQVVVVADRGVRDRLANTDLDSVIAAATRRLANGALKEGLLEGLARLEEVLIERGFQARPGRANEISDAVIRGEPS